MRVTNVTGAGMNCNWCQQTTWERLQVSSDYETFTTTPTNGLIIDNQSSANIANQINIDHVSGTGIVLKYAFNTLIHGGTSEGNGGYGVTCSGESDDGGGFPLFECFGNTIIQLDAEVNTLGDFYWNDIADHTSLAHGHVFNNTVFQSNSFSIPGYTLTGAAHSNTFVGGLMGCGSTAAIHTYGNPVPSISASVVRRERRGLDLGQKLRRPYL